jgi:hypothetical protein
VSQNQQNRQSSVSQNQQNRQSSVSQNQQNRQNYASENWDGYYGPRYGYPVGVAAVAGVTGYAVGAASQPTPVVAALPCTPTVVRVGEENYYQCDGNWYAKVYSGSSVTYVAVQPPP